MSIKSIIRTKFPKAHSFLQEKKQEAMYYIRKHQKPEKYPKLLEKRFYELTGHKMDINHPQTYSEKIQWLKLYDPNPLRSMLADKVAVRAWIKEKIGEEYLIPLYGVYNTFDEIDFDSLPNQFVIKTNHSSGWNIVVSNKETFDRSLARKKINKWLSMDYAFWTEYEPHYSKIKPMILIEKYMEDSTGGLTDYKFLCFNGVEKYVWVDYDRFTNHKRNIYDMDWNIQPWNQFTYGNHEGGLPPKNFELMKQIAHTLCQGFIHVRVDLYNVDGNVYFGEMTFTNGSGFEQFHPYEYENEIGKLIHLPID